jgi:hypothetical protein
LAWQRDTLTPVERSTRLSILEHALADVVERLAELPPSGDADKLRALAHQYEAELERWEKDPPAEARRAELLKSVLDLSVEVIRSGGRTSARPESESDASDDDYPKAL